QASQGVADAVFAAARGTVASPARSALGWHVMRVDAIETRAARTLDQARGEITAQLVATKRRAALTELLTRIEDEFDQGGNLGDAAEELGIEVKQTKPVTADGRLYDAPDQQIPEVLNRVLQ